MKWLAVLFSLFLCVIIALADLGFLGGPLRALHRIPYGDKIGHFSLVGILAFLVITSLIQTLPARDPNWVAFSTAFILAVIFTIEEASQGPIRGRDASWKDLFANYAGIVFFGLIAWHLNRKRKP